VKRKPARATWKEDVREPFSAADERWFAARSVLCRVQHPRRLLHRPEARRTFADRRLASKNDRIRPGAARIIPEVQFSGDGSPQMKAAIWRNLKLPNSPGFAGRGHPVTSAPVSELMSQS